VARVVLSAVVVAGLNGVRVQTDFVLKPVPNWIATAGESNGFNQFSVQRKEK